MSVCNCCLRSAYVDGCRFAVRARGGSLSILFPHQNLIYVA
jgi:hypothetical protein